MATILETILARKRLEVADLDEGELRRRCADRPPIRDFAAALAAEGSIHVIAEIKKASPSAGLIRSSFDPVAIARAYESNGAACLSVLTDGAYFQGGLGDLAAARDAVSLPVLRKEFIIDARQILEAAAAGADAILLIAEILSDDQLLTFRLLAEELRLTVLVECHDAANVERVVASGARLIGINNRDLRTLVTRLDHTLELAPHVPPDRILVSESGIKTAAEVARLHNAGVKAILVGESLLRQPDPGRALRELLGR